jgi:hypothetical protein
LVIVRAVTESLSFVFAAYIGYVSLALEEGSWVSGVTVESVFFKDAKLILDPLFSEKGGTFFDAGVFVNELVGHFNVFSWQTTATKLNSPGVFSEQRVEGGHIYVCFPVEVGYSSGGRGTGLNLPGQRQLDENVFEMDKTVGECKNISRRFCQKSLNIFKSSVAFIRGHIITDSNGQTSVFIRFSTGDADGKRQIL